MNSGVLEVQGGLQMGMLTRVIKLCKKNMRIYIFRDTQMNYWLSCYDVHINLGTSFAASETDILALLELPPDKEDAVKMETDDELHTMPEPQGDPLERLPYSLNVINDTIQPFKCEYGTVFLDTEHINVFGEFNKTGMVTYYLTDRKTVNVYHNDELVGVIEPQVIPYDKICAFASKLMKLTFKARKNGFYCDSEQMSLLDETADTEE